MPRAGFYNDNEYRAYPFVMKKAYASAQEFPAATIVDCGFIMGLDSAYDAATHAIYLHSVARTEDSFEFVFKTNAPGAADLPITFVYDLNAQEWDTNFAESAPNTADNFCAEEPAWDGFIVVGRLDELKELLPAVGVITFYAPTLITAEDTPDYTVEPARAQSLVRSYVRSIGVANYARPRVPDCGESSSSTTPMEDSEREIIVHSTCIRGNIKLKAGYNCAIRQPNNTNTLTVTAFRRDRGVTEAETEICQYGSELPLIPGQVPPEGRPFLSGGPACDELITSINGVGGNNVVIAADAGIQIVSLGDNSIKIDVTPNIVQQNCG